MKIRRATEVQGHREEKEEGKRDLIGALGTSTVCGAKTMLRQDLSAMICSSH
jgi:hypothetical protein